VNDDGRIDGVPFRKAGDCASRFKSRSLVGALRLRVMTSQQLY